MNIEDTILETDKNDYLKYTSKSIERCLSNLNGLDNLLGGFTYDGITLWVAQTNAGKTTLLSMLCRNFIRQGKKVFYFNGEQTFENFENSLYIQNTPSSEIRFRRYKDTQIVDAFIDGNALDNASDLYDGNIYIYNNKAKRDINSILKTMKYCIDTKGVRDFIIDNLMQIDNRGDDQFREQERIAEDLRTFAVNNKSNIHLVAHSRKTNGNAIRLTLFDIAGSQTIANKAFNIVTITRIDQLDKDSSEYDRLRIDLARSHYNIEKCDSALEVLKTKYSNGGHGLIGLKYDRYNRSYQEVPKENIKIENSRPKFI